MIYLVSPFSHDDQMVEHDRYLAAKAATARLLAAGHQVFSPIAYSFQFAHVIEGSFAAWSEFDLAMIDAADSVAVLMLDGWRESVGVQAELRHARAAGKPVVFLDPVTLEPVDTLKIG